MAVFLREVEYWVAEWAATGEPISESVARTIASYWVAGPGPLAEMARGWHVSDRQSLCRRASTTTA